MKKYFYLSCQTCDATLNRHSRKFCSVSCYRKSCRTKATVECLNCGIKFKKFLSFLKRHKRSFCSKRCMGLYWTGPKSPSWKRGWFIGKNGYKVVRIGGKRFYEHRIFMEQHIGRKLKSSEVVHHLNGNPLDNRMRNLMLFKTHSDHMKHHIVKRSL